MTGYFVLQFSHLKSLIFYDAHTYIAYTDTYMCLYTPASWQGQGDAGAQIFSLVSYSQERSAVSQRTAIYKVNPLLCE